MIRSFRGGVARGLFEREPVRDWPPTLQRAALRKLEMLKGNRAGQYSIRINDQWRVCFRWRSGDALDVEIVDYHT